jgi:prepilin-type N-terminal cleavage/methylation domain-containing protein
MSQNENLGTQKQSGFSMLELLISTAILLIVSSVVMSAIIQTVRTEGTTSNRTQMHAAVRSATELMQQEIGQAGRVSLPVASASGPTIKTSTAVATTDLGALTGTAVTVNNTTGLFDGEQLVVDVGANEETVPLISHTGTSITATFTLVHAVGVSVVVEGGFPSGVVPPSVTNGSTSSVLKIFGDINSDGNMVYVEYHCDTNGGNLHRNSMAIAAASKPAEDNSTVLLPNITANPGGTPCFTYQVKTVGSNDYVVNVAVTLTVNTAIPDPQTGQIQTETKALLNVSPRNVFEIWQSASGGNPNRIQPMPANVTCLLTATSTSTCSGT